MRQSTDMRETILRKSRDLFAEYGYSSTSIKQIAQASGCATSALYYYFPQGKSQILNEVAQSYSLDLFSFFASCREATSLPDLLARFGQSLSQSLPDLIRRSNWLFMDFPRLRPEEKKHIQNILLSLHTLFVHEIMHFVPSEQHAKYIAWMVVCTYFGYEQLFLSLDLAQATDMSLQDLIPLVTETISQAHPHTS